MYLKDCIVSLTFNGDKEPSKLGYPFLWKDETNFQPILKDGRSLGTIPINSDRLIDLKGTPISDRDYRLAIARSLSLKSLNHNH